jgi:hypothetical protein
MSQPGRSPAEGRPGSSAVRGGRREAGTQANETAWAGTRLGLAGVRAVRRQQRWGSWRRKCLSPGKAGGSMAAESRGLYRIETAR